MGCWCAPYKTAQAEEIRQLMMQPLMKAGAEDKLYNLIGDDELFDDLYDLKGDEDCRATVLTFLQGWFGNTGDDEDLRESWGWSEDYNDGALAIFKEMLTDWEVNKRFPANRTDDGKTIMTPRELAMYMSSKLEEKAKDQPMVMRKIFKHVFPDIPITAKKDGTFVIDLDT